MLRREQVGYLIRESLAGFHRRKLTTAVTILIMASALLVLSLFTLVTVNLGALVAKAHSGIDLRVFLAGEIPPELQPELQLRLLAIDGVQSAVYIGKEQALAEFRRELGEDAVLLDTLDQNPLPTSYHVTLTPAARTSQAAQAVRDQLSTWPEIEDIAFSQVWVEVLERWTFLFRMASLLVGLIVFVAAVFVISNTVKLTVAASERVIEVMKLVGATNFLIRTPFLCEGMLEGMLGGMLAMAVVGVTYAIMSPQIQGLIFFTPLQVAGFVLFCLSLGLIGSWSAMRKYLKL